MSCYSHSETDAAFAVPRTFSFFAVLSRVADHFRRARERQELINYLASDHRAARDLGITIHTAAIFSPRQGPCVVHADVQRTAPHKNWAKLNGGLRTVIWIRYTPKIYGFVVLLARIGARIKTIEIPTHRSLLRYLALPAT